MKSMEYIASHFVGDDVRGYFADCFSKVEDDVKSKRGRKKNFDKQTIFSFGQHLYNTLHHLQPWRNNQRNNREKFKMWLLWKMFIRSPMSLPIK